MSELLTPGEIDRGIMITTETYRSDDRHRAIADRVLAALGYRPEQVVELRATRKMVSLLVLNRRPGAEPTERWQRFTINGDPIIEDDDG